MLSKEILPRMAPLLERKCIMTDYQIRLLKLIIQDQSFMKPDRQAIQAALDEIRYWRDLDWRSKNQEDSNPNLIFKEK